MKTSHLSISPQRQSVVLLPNMTSSTFGVVEQMSFVDTSALLSGRSKSPGFSVFVYRLCDPVVSGISSNGLMLGINQNNFIVLISRILINPIRVKDSQIRSSSTNSLFSSGSQRSLVFELVYSHVGGLTISGTLRDRSLSSTSSDSDSVNYKTLLGLVTKSSSLIRSRRSRSTMNNVELSVFPASDTMKESEHIRLLISRNFFQIFVGSHCILCCYRS